MVLKKFRYVVIFRVLLLIVSMALFFYLLTIEVHYISSAFLGVLIVVQTAWLIYSVEETNRNLTCFLESIRFSDFSFSIQNDKSGKSFEELDKAFNMVFDDFKKKQTESNKHYRYLAKIIQSTDVSFIAFRSDGAVELINNAAKKLFQINSLKHIKELIPYSRKLYQTLEKIQAGNSLVVKVQDYEDLLHLSVSAAQFELDGRTITFVAIRNIHAELEEQEMEAWQKLVRVLTHEIMNSIAPIASLSSTTNIMVNEIVNQTGKNEYIEIEYETLADIQNALKTIYKRSAGLLEFVETYRNLTRIPQPNFTLFSVSKLFDYLKTAMNDELKANNVDLTISIDPENLKLMADEQLIEQVLINLLKNSIEALRNTKDAKIKLKAFVNKRDKITIQVIDNGQGIIKEVKDKIFIPFFTTKHSGSGIGLSLSKQIMRLHNGTIAVKSKPDEKTCFTLTF